MLVLVVAVVVLAAFVVLALAVVFFLAAVVVFVVVVFFAVVFFTVVVAVAIYRLLGLAVICPNFKENFSIWQNLMCLKILNHFSRTPPSY